MIIVIILDHSIDYSRLFYKSFLVRCFQRLGDGLNLQAHFEGMTRLGFRHRVAQAAHLAGWRLQDERRCAKWQDVAGVAQFHMLDFRLLKEYVFINV